MKYKDVWLYKLLRPIINFIFKVLFLPQYTGLENIPKEGKIILAGNHISIMDPLFLISATKRNIHFLAKIELFRGVKKILFANMGLIPVNRSIKDHSVLVNAKKYLENDLVIGIFPEGTTKKKAKVIMLPFKIGAVKLANDTNTKIIPFAIKGKYKLFARPQIKFLKPITIKEKDLKKENDKLYNIIRKELEDNNVFI